MLGAMSPLLGLLLLAPLQGSPVPAPVAETAAPRAPLDAGLGETPGASQALDALLASAHPGPPAELFAVERVVDGDTLYVWRDGQVEKLRLLSVDTEEKLSDNPSPSPSKPETVFGQETMLWARALVEGTAAPGEPARVGLRFPADGEQRDAYGRLLCHVVLADGRDFNLLLVELGKSPYFDKYGRSRICHEAFVAAQASAQAAGRGIWNPTTNAAATPGAPSARRPYELLLPWWRARADAVEQFRRLAAEDPAGVVDAEVPDQLQTALERGEPVRVFGSLFETFDEPDGSWTLLFRAPGGERALRVSVPAEHRAAFAPLALERTREDYRQNYLWVEGTVQRGPRGYTITCEDPARIRVAEPAYDG